MRILTRYLLRAHIGPFFFALFALTGVMFVNVIARRVQDLAGKGLPLSIIFEVFYLSMPHILALTLPMAVLVATLYAFAQLAADNEITALKASGVNLARLLVPLLVVALMFSGFMIWFNDRVLPETNHQLKNLVADVATKTPTLELTEQLVNPIRTDDYRTRYWLRAGRIDDANNRLLDVVIYDMSNARKARTIYADSGRMQLNAAQTDMLLTLFDGVVHEVDEHQQQELQRVWFREQRVELKGVGTQLKRSYDEYRSDREMSVAMLKAVVDSSRRNMVALQDEALQLNRANLDRVLAGHGEAEIVPEDGSRFLPAAARRTAPQYAMASRSMNGSDDLVYRTALEARRIANNKATLQDTINQFRVEYHKKFAIPFACIIFVLLGAPLAVRFPRGGVGMVIACSFTIFGIYYMSLIGGEALGDRGRINPFWGPWAPNIFFGAIALWGLTRMGKETAHSRGGGWDDLWYTVRSAASLPFRRRERRRVGSEARA
jgi:lipopolysaccharide export system permease protein